MKQDFKIGITQTFDCNYLEQREERLLIAVDERLNDSEHYSWLMTQGFRRSGNQIYRPHCPNCTECQSIRVLVNSFQPSSSQKRLNKKCHGYLIKISKTIQENYFNLYEKYINTVHRDGSMYPASKEQFLNFLSCNITKQLFIEIWDGEKLISVAVTDKLDNGLSAVYTFYDPEYKKKSIGLFSILSQINIAKEHGKQFLYLGYQIDACRKMNYKNRYFPHQRLINNQWHQINKPNKDK